MKLVLSTTQSDRFREFHETLQQDEKVYDYLGYSQLLFEFSKNTVKFTTLDNGLIVNDYEGVHLTSYGYARELATAAAITLQANDISFSDTELVTSGSFSKLTEYARLAAAGVNIPKSYAGHINALRRALDADLLSLEYPLVLKRADADRGNDNYLISSRDQLAEKLTQAQPKTLWIIQEFIENDGFYRLTYFGDTLSSVVFRSKVDRTDGNEEKSHLNKPVGGGNASLVEVVNVPQNLDDESRKACQAMNRQFAGVDVLLNKAGEPYILEVNYNPQLVTALSFTDVRKQAFLQAMKDL